jgi:1,4-dihydroxy-2-naphthoyl-CoA synthase
VSIYAAGRADGALTVMVVNLALEEKTKAIRIEGQAQVRADAWLFDLDHKAEKVGALEISDRITVLPESVTLTAFDSRENLSSAC